MKNKGITLIALVITVIVLLILAGISISMLAGDNSILQRAVDAKEATEEAEIREKIQLAELAAMVNKNVEVDYDLLKEALTKEFGTEGTDWTISEKTENPWVVTVGKVEYEIEGASTEQETPGLYYAGTDELIMTWEELITPSNNMLIDNNGTLQRSAFKLNNVTDKKGNTVGSTALVKLVVDPSITSTGSLSGLTQLAEIELPNTITSVSQFASCTNLKSIKIPDSVTSIGSATFAYCSALKELIIGNGVKEIPYNMLDSVYDLEKLVIGDGVTEIPDSFLAGGRSQDLIELKFGKNIERIGKHAFDAGFTKLKEVVLPEKVKIIDERAFADCESLEKIEFPEGLESIGVDAFDECRKIKSITLPSSLRTLEKQAFYDCSGIEEITILNGLTTIQESSFSASSSKLKTIKIPASVTTIEKENFSRCSGLTDIYYGGTSSQWNNISIGNYNNYLLSATLHENS